MRSGRHLNEKQSRQAKGMDRLASSYGRLKRMVFGRKLELAESHFLQVLSAAGRLMIIGGGQGNILPDILKHNPKLQVLYVDASEKMTDIAERRLKRKGFGCEKIRFINAFAEDVLPDQCVDIVMTSFVMDFYQNDEVEHLIHRIMANVDPHTGLWLNTDFRNNNTFFGKCFIRFMYCFFNLFCKLGVANLPDYDRCFVNSGWRKTRSKSFCNGLVETAVYQTSVTE